MRTALIFGGSSGLGLELAKKLKKTHSTFVTGRHNPNEDGINFKPFNITTLNGLLPNIETLMKELPKINLLVLAAGFFQKGTVSELSDDQIETMILVGLVAPILLVNRILKSQSNLEGLIVVTSTSQWTPRLEEPVYTAVKGGLGMFANSVSLDKKIGKVLVAGPAGMLTNFWKNTSQDTSKYMPPEWVADQILNIMEEDFKYKFIKILRDPPRVEHVETR